VSLVLLASAFLSGFDHPPRPSKLTVSRLAIRMRRNLMVAMSEPFFLSKAYSVVLEVQLQRLAIPSIDSEGLNKK